MRTIPEPDPASRRGRILAFIRSQAQHGATDTEIARALGLPLNRVGPQRIKLWNQEFIGYSGSRRPRKAVAWMALPADFYDRLRARSYPPPPNLFTSA